MNDTLTIKGEKKEDKGKTYHRVERPYGSFIRKITLPLHVNADKVEAKENQGVLEIILPKMEKAGTKKVTVNTA